MTREMIDMRTAWDDLDGHLADWGLRHFTDDEAYFRWQRETLSADDIAEVVAWIVSLPPHVNINRIEIMPNCQGPGPMVIKRTAPI